MNTYRITYKINRLELPETVEADGYRTAGRFFEFYTENEYGVAADVIASISSDLVAYVSTARS